MFRPVLMTLSIFASSLGLSKDLKVALILPGPVNDLSWNGAALTGLKAACEAGGAKIAYQENVADADVERVLRGYATEGYTLILAESFNYQDATIRVARDFPNAFFATATGFKTQADGHDVPPNHAVYDWPAHHAGYLTGVLAALMTRSKTVGFVGGYEVPDIIRQAEGFKQGVRATDPTVKVRVIYTGSWSDAAKGKEAGLSLIDLGADVVEQAADGPGVGAIVACKERKVKAIGYVADQNRIAPDTVLTSVILEKKIVYETLLAAVKEGKFEGKSYLFDLLQGGVSLAPFHGLVPAEVEKKVQEAEKKIRAGGIKVEERLKSTAE